MRRSCQVGTSSSHCSAAVGSFTMNKAACRQRGGNDRQSSDHVNTMLTDRSLCTHPSTDETLPAT